MAKRWGHHEQPHLASRRGSVHNAQLLPVLAPDAPGSPKRRESEADQFIKTNTQCLWLLLLSTAAECLTTCYIPDWFWGDTKLNLSATALNFIGPFIDGMSYGFEDLPKTTTIPIPGLQFRSAFLGVFTSYSFMVDHAGDLSAEMLLLGSLYILVSIFGACASFHLGRAVVRYCFENPAIASMINGATFRMYPSFLFYVVAFILLTIMRANFGPSGFVRDPKDPQFIGNLRVQDGEELFLGIVMSCSAILMSDYICERLKARPDAIGINSFMDWGCLLCNFMSCFLTAVAYGASQWSPNAIQNNLLILKFVSSFCGSISCFSDTISHIMLLWHSGNRTGALWNFSLHVIVALMFVPYLNKTQTTYPFKYDPTNSVKVRSPLGLPLAGTTATMATSATSASIPAELLAALKEHGQEHLLKFHDAGKLTPRETQALVDELKQLDFAWLKSIFDASTSDDSTYNQQLAIEPLEQFDQLEESAPADQQRWLSSGLKAISQNEVCALVLSGGQGTRLGFPFAKGMYNIGLHSEKSLFQIFAERVRKLEALAAAAFPPAAGHVVRMPFLVMTSPMNHDETLTFFRNNAFFGLDEQQLFFFRQGTLPCFSMDGKLMMENKCKLASASDGNGSIYKALETTGALARLQQGGVKYLHVFSVDNVLCKVADPVFIGYCIDRNADCANKVVWKSSAHERVGVVAKKNGKFCVVEYSELDNAKAELIDKASGKLAFGAGNICNHFFTIDFLANVVLPNLSLEYHVAKKKIPMADDNGETFTPSQNSGVKLESFIFDTFPLSSRMAVLAVARETEFAPVKNPPGSPSDSPDSARKMLQNEANSWLAKAARATLSADEADAFISQYLSEDVTVEISPLASYNGEGLESHIEAIRQHEEPRKVLVLESAAFKANKSSVPASIRSKFEAAGQSHIFRFVDNSTVSAVEALDLVEDVRPLNPASLAGLFTRSTTADAKFQEAPDEIEPLANDVVDVLDRTDAATRERWLSKGLDTIAQGLAAALVLGGGQGTRLGFDGPKGMYDVGLPSGKSLFEIFALRARKVEELAQKQLKTSERPRVPFFVMTSEMNHSTTVQFFKQHHYFGLLPAQVRFFCQGTLPCFTLDGKFILDSPAKLSRASDGNGGIYPSMKASGILQHMETSNIQYLHVFSVDNVLCKVADPVFIGYCVENDADCANKVVWKDRPHESVGVFAKKNGKFCVVEYSELDKESSELINPATGSLAFGAGNICNHFYRLDFLKFCCDLEDFGEYHVAKKKIPYVDESGQQVTPTTNTGIKLETFIFDVFQHAKNMKVLAVARQDEFAPVKNAPGTAVDSPDTARHLFSEQCKRWLLEAGATFDDGSNGLCEITPSVSYNGEGLEAVAQAKSPIKLPVLID
ncbi:TPA: hypothetical protein N0F65_005778 [Lagenidium giganteum]|uniref:UDP-N-acetylglucosamine diphosphorylase n=1 Tax=Lagenidium giganteum TaxID=4803 RepID=A0AAV2YRP7_9STRA|nr:TPA: hypothetical protein N0F65_005778 [Lagenidium giganteum]